MICFSQDGLAEVFVKAQILGVHILVICIDFFTLIHLILLYHILIQLFPLQFFSFSIYLAYVSRIKRRDVIGENVGHALFAYMLAVILENR
jgi:hypothetical protein